jgi:hypothetical protein
VEASTIDVDPEQLASTAMPQRAFAQSGRRCDDLDRWS